MTLYCTQHLCLQSIGLHIDNVVYTVLSFSRIPFDSNVDRYTSISCLHIPVFYRCNRVMHVLHALCRYDNAIDVAVGQPVGAVHSVISAPFPKLNLRQRNKSLFSGSYSRVGWNVHYHHFIYHFKVKSLLVKFMMNKTELYGEKHRPTQNHY